MHFAFKGGITPFLSLIFILLLTLIGALIQSASIQIAKSTRTADMELALENLFAEYNVELLEEYGVFAREGKSIKETVERLEFYGIVETQHEITSSTLLSDSDGLAFYEQALLNMGSVSESTEVFTEHIEEHKDGDPSEKLDTLLEQEGATLPQENNPIEAVKTLKNTNLLSLIYPNLEELSNQSVKLERLPSHRTLEEGEGNVRRQAEKSIKNQTLFALYLNEHFQNAIKMSKVHPLLYEAEYLLAGKESDRENLKSVAEKILAIRMAVNYAYIFTDEVKLAEADIVALGLSSLLMNPEAKEVVKQAILFAWVYGESIVDLRLLMENKRVPLMKTKETWQINLTHLFQLAAGREVGSEKLASDGITYSEYIKALLVAEKREVLCMRALDLLELNTGVRVDNCLTQLELKNTCVLQKKVTYIFQTNYEYQ